MERSNELTSNGRGRSRLDRIEYSRLNRSSSGGRRFPPGRSERALSRDHKSRGGERARSGSSTSYEQNDSERRRRRKRRRSASPARRKERRKSCSEERDNSRHSSRRSRRRRERSRRRNSEPSPAIHESCAGIVSDDDEAVPSLNYRRNTTQEGFRSNQPQHRRTPSPHDDSVGHFRGCLGSVIGDRYRILREVGLGTFGRVVECVTLNCRPEGARNRRLSPERCPYVAIKIVRNVKRYYESALIEARIVQDVNRRGGRGQTHCVILHNTFTFNGHFCMVFESLGPSLYDFLKKHEFQPYPMVCVQDFTIQLLETVEFLHSFRLIHTDLKVENILLMNDREVFYGHQRVPASTRIKVIDFGGACYDSEKKSSVINTRQYRAPEVILGIGWSMPSDIWSVGCILAELYHGELLFATHDNVEHLALIERTIGWFPRRMVRASQDNKNSDLASVVFDSSGRHRLGRVMSSENVSFVNRAAPLESMIRNEDTWFLHLLRMLLVIDPHERATAHECLQYLNRIRRDVVRYN